MYLTYLNTVSGFHTEGGGAWDFPPQTQFRISGLYYDISIDLMQVLGL